jgi:glycosyltransferase involved in cell wall biosynthesis
MRIAVNTRFLIPDRLEGIGWFTHEVVKRMVTQFPEHEYLFIFDRPFSEQFVFSSNVRPIHLPPPARHPFLWYAWFEWSIPFLFKKYRPDVFFSPDGYASLRSKVPTAMVIHDLAYVHFPEQIPSLARKYYQHFIPRYLHNVENIVTVSSFVKNDILATYPKISEEKISIACNGVREGFRPLSKEEQQEVKTQFSQGQDYFFYVGAVHPRKNVHRLIQAFDLFKGQSKHPMKLLIGGRFAWQTGEVKAAFESAVHQKDIEFLGYLPEEQLFQLMGAATALTYPSNFEGFGIPVLEALYCDIPVITSNVSSLPEVAGPGGLLVDPKNIHQMAEAMGQIAFENALRQQLISQARQWRTRFSWDKATEACYQAIEQAVSSSKR